MSSLDNPIIPLSPRINSITVERGEWITLYLNRAEWRGQRDCATVEVRVTKDGEPQAFSDDVALKSFDDHESSWGTPLRQRHDKLLAACENIVGLYDLDEPSLPDPGDPDQVREWLAAIEDLRNAIAATEES